MRDRGRGLMKDYFLKINVVVLFMLFRLYEKELCICSNLLFYARIFKLCKIKVTFVVPEQTPTLLVPRLEEPHVHKSLIDHVSYWELLSSKGGNWYDKLNQSIQDYISNHGDAIPPPT
jgi:hypothetical protein